MSEDLEKDQPIHQGAPETPPIESVTSPVLPRKHIALYIIPGVLVLSIVGFFLIRGFGSRGNDITLPKEDAPIEEVLSELDESVVVEVKKSMSKENTVVITADKLDGKYVSIGYELQYESGGVGKGVTSGSKPLEVSGQDSFEREIYLGTCSKNVCKPDLGVTNIDVVLEFTDTSGKKSQFSKTFEL